MRGELCEFCALAVGVVVEKGFKEQVSTANPMEVVD
jgi:hypothetical protein